MGYRVKSSWWRPSNSGEALGRLSNNEIARQEKEYVRWLQRRWNCSEKDAQLLIEVQRDDTAEPAPVPVESSVREERWIDERVCIRTVRCHYTKHHWGAVLTSNSCPPAIQEWTWTGRARWHRQKKPDYPPVYVVMVDGKRRNSFLKLSLARDYADRECSSSTKSAA